MLIQCPECQFSRTLDESKIPPTAKIATCPHCNARFNFRPSHDENEAPENPQDSTKYEENRNPQADNSWQSPTDDKNDGYNQQPYNPSNRSPEQDPEEQRNNSRQRNDHDKPKDIWDHIASLGEKWDQQKTGSRQEYFQEEQEPRGRAGLVPWEHPEQFGYVGGFFKTIMRVIMRGKLFFSAMPHNTKLAKPISFFFLIILLQFLISFFWIKLASQNPEVATNLEQFNATMSQVSFLQFLFLILLNAALTLLMLSVTFSLLLRLSGLKNATFSQTIRILCYASSGFVLVFIPFIGPIMSLLFVALSTFQGFAYSYNLPPFKAALFVFPVYLLLFIVVLSTSMAAM